MQEKMKRQERNMMKYPIPNSGNEYNYARSKNTESFDSLEWCQYIRKEEIIRQKKKEK